MVLFGSALIGGSTCRNLAFRIRKIKDYIDDYNVKLQAFYIGEESYSSYTRNPTTTQLFT